MLFGALGPAASKKSPARCRARPKVGDDRFSARPRSRHRYCRPRLRRQPQRRACGAPRPYKVERLCCVVLILARKSHDVQCRSAAASGERETRRGREMVARVTTATRSEKVIASAPARRRRTSRARWAMTKPLLLRRIGRIAWVPPLHAALALTTGVACGALAARFGGIVAPPYAAIFGAAVVYPALVAVWRRIPRRGWHRR
jgi:hypothetical protein